MNGLNNAITKADTQKTLLATTDESKQEQKRIANIAKESKTSLVRASWTDSIEHHFSPEELVKPSEEKIQEINAQIRQANSKTVETRLRRMDAKNKQGDKTERKTFILPDGTTHITQTTRLEEDPLRPHYIVHKDAVRDERIARVPVLRTPTKKASKETLKAWRIPPVVSSHTNKSGFAMGVEARARAEVKEPVFTEASLSSHEKLVTALDAAVDAVARARSQRILGKGVGMHKPGQMSDTNQELHKNTKTIKEPSSKREPVFEIDKELNDFLGFEDLDTMDK